MRTSVVITLRGVQTMQQPADTDNFWTIQGRVVDQECRLSQRRQCARDEHGCQGEQRGITSRTATPCLLAILFATVPSFRQEAAWDSKRSVVLDRDGKLISDAYVYGLPEENMYFHATTSAQGKFTLDDLPVGLIYLHAYSC
jgi:hypothetical protein